MDARWTARDIAEYLGVKSPAAARVWVARMRHNGVELLSESGGYNNWTRTYDPEQIREARIAQIKASGKGWATRRGQ